MNEELDDNGSCFIKHHAGILTAQPSSDNLINPTCATCAGNPTASHEACYPDCMFLEGNVAKNRHLILWSDFVRHGLHMTTVILLTCPRTEEYCVYLKSQPAHSLDISHGFLACQFYTVYY